MYLAHTFDRLSSVDVDEFSTFQAKLELFFDDVIVPAEKVPFTAMDKNVCYIEQSKPSWIASLLKPFSVCTADTSDFGGQLDATTLSAYMIRIHNPHRICDQYSSFGNMICFK